MYIKTIHIHYIYIYIYDFSCTHTFTHTYIYIHKHACMHACMHTSIHPYKHTYIHTYLHTHIHTHIYIYIISLGPMAVSRPFSAASSKTPRSLPSMGVRGLNGIRYDLDGIQYDFNVFVWIITRDLMGFDGDRTGYDGVSESRVSRPIICWLDSAETYVTTVGTICGALKI